MTPKVLVPRQPGSHRAENTTSNLANRYYRHIDGIRGFALALVVIFHIFVGKVSSGVDVFLFIGGLLLISSQLRNAQRDNGLSMHQSIIRIMRRLYPALIVAISGGLISSLMIYPPAQWSDILRHGSASSLYGVNWVFIQDNQSYARASSDADVFQHLWSMSIQFQIYVAIIALITLIAALSKKYGFSARKVTGITVSVLALASFAHAIWLNHIDQSANYYSTFSRFWEIALGGLVGLYLLDKVVLSPQLRWVSATIGIALIIFSGVVLNGVEQFPGPLTLLPLLGAMLIVFSGTRTKAEKTDLSSLGPVLLFETKPLLWLGKISYSLYLWHWVVIIITAQIVDAEDGIDPLVGIIVIVVSIAFACLSYFFVEKPLRQKTKPQRRTLQDVFLGSDRKKSRRASKPLWMRTAASATVVMIVTVAVSPVIYTGVNYAKHKQLERYIEDHGGMSIAYPGAKSFLSHSNPPEDLKVLPDPNSEALEMMPQSQKDFCFSDFDNDDIVTERKDGNPCEYGDTSSDKTMYVIGGSHSEMYLPALDIIAKERGFKIVPMIKMGCALFHNQKWDGSDYPGCVDFSEKVVDYIKDNPPTEGIFHTSTRPESFTGKGPEVVPEGYLNAMREFSELGINMYLIRDVPWSVTEDGKPIDVRVCMSQALSDKRDDIDDYCGFPVANSMAEVDPALEAYKDISGVKLLDINSSLQKDGHVFPVVGNTLVYRDSHHITNLFAESLTDEIDRQMYKIPATPQSANHPVPVEPQPAIPADNPEGIPPTPDLGM